MAIEGGANVARFRLTRTGNAYPSLTVIVGVSGTATPATDFDLSTGLFGLTRTYVEFGSGQTTADVVLTAPADEAEDDYERATLTVLDYYGDSSDPGPYTVGSPT